jgi:hypothetical protein
MTDDLIVSGKGNFAPHPDGGPYAAVCVDVVNMPQRQTKYGLQDKVRIVFETELEMEPDDQGGVRPWLQMAFFGKTIGEKSNLRKFLKSWRGRDFTPEELEAFNLETLVGAQARLIIEHTQDGTDTYANITAILRTENGKILKPSGAYQRVKDRSPMQVRTQGRPLPQGQPLPASRYAQPATPAPTPAPAAEPDDDNIPF